MRSGVVFAGRYLLECRAGAGGMGEVWKALDQDTGEVVAVKLLPDQTPEGAARFTREAQILSTLTHPQVVRYFAHGRDPEGAPYLVMEWLDGEDLAARLSRGPLAVDESVALAIAVAEALAFAHERAVVHRDLKPSNLFLPGGRLDAMKVLDFGIAHAGMATRMTRTGMLVGTPGYMAPEQARGEATIDARADVFSLGCILFECLTGAPAFDGQHAAAILTKVLFEETPSTRSTRPEVPQALDDLVRKMLSKRREERPEGGHAAAMALRALGQMPSESPAASTRAPSLTGSEQRVIAVIVVSAPAPVDAPSGVFDGDSVRRLDPDEAEILHEAEAHGGVGERLLDGSVVILMAGTGLATDLCAQAARCALSLRTPARGRRVVLAMGRSDRTARSFGRAIDRAARLSDAPARDADLDGAVMIDEVVAGLLDARFDVREDESSFTLHGERPLAESTRLLLGKATPCVGRERELDTLRALFTESMEDGTAQAVLVVAPPGVGKSRLAQEFLREARAHGAALSLWVARGDAQRAGSPLGMLGQLLRNACGIREGEPLGVRREKLAAQVAAWVAPDEQRRVAEFLGEIVGAPFPDVGSLPMRSARLDAQLMADQVRAAFLDFLGAACEKAPVLVLVEDLHWADRTTVQILDAAMRTLAERPLFVLALARPEVREVFPKLWEERRLHALRLVELSRRAGERLAKHALGERADAEVVARIVRLSEGNAFYLEELIRWTAEGKGAEMPETVVAMVESRLGALDERGRRLLRAASVFGEAFWAGGVAALLGGEAHRSAVLAGLAALVDREILVRRSESRFPGEEELAFRHALLREGAYAMLTEADRTLGHRLAGEWLEARGEGDARALAEHFEKGGDGPGAARNYLRAAQQASSAADAQASATLARRGLVLPLPREQRTKLLGALCESAMWQPNLAVSLRDEAEELTRIAPRGSTPWVQGIAARLFGAAIEGKVEEISGLVGELRRADIAPAAVHPMAVTLSFGAYILDMRGRSTDADVLHAELVARTQAGGDPAASATREITSAARAGQQGEPVAMLAHALEAREIARQCGHRRLETIATLAIAKCMFCLGAWDEAERMLKGVPLSDTEFGPISAFRPFIMAWMLAERGALAEARTHADHLASNLGRARGLLMDEGRGRWVLAEVMRRAGEFEGAESEVESAVVLLSKTCPADVSGVLATKAALKLQQGQPVEALAAAEAGLLRQATMKVEDHFFRGFFLRLVHVESLEANGRPEEARSALASAKGRLLAIAATIDDPARRKSYFERVPENRRVFELARQWLGEGG